MSTTGKCIQTPLTVGVELEFLACIPDNGGQVPKTAVYNVLLQKVPIACRNKSCSDKEHMFHLPVARLDQYGLYANTSSYDGWMVSTDVSVKLNKDTEEHLLNLEESSVGSIEIQSRILNFHTKNPCPHNQTWPCTGKPLEFEWHEEIALILKTLTSAFSKSGHRLYTNSSCGMHVHVGRQQHGFPLMTAQNVLATFTALERAFDSIQPVSRIGGFSGDAATTCLPGLDTMGFIYPYKSDTEYTDLNRGNGQYLQPLSTKMFTVFSKNLKGVFDSMEQIKDNAHLNDEDRRRLDKLNGRCDTLLKRFNVPAWLNAIEKVKSMKELGTYNTPHISSINLQHIVSESSSKKKTIEFRSHAGTLDIAEITAWIDFVATLTTFCSAPTNQIFNHLRNVWANPTYTLLNLCEDINVSPKTLAHYTSVLAPNDSYTRTRTQRITSNLNNPNDTLHQLTRRVALNRNQDFSLPNVNAKIRFKLESGRYGQFPASFVRHMLGADKLEQLTNSFLCLDQCKWDEWRIAARRALLDTQEVEVPVDEDMTDVQGFFDN